MLKTPSLKSFSNPSERNQSEQYIQCYTNKIVRQVQQLNSSYYEEDQFDQCQNTNHIQQFEDYMQNLVEIISNPPNSQYLSKYYVLSTENETITFISETHPETLMDYIKLRHQNNAPMNEDEIVQLAYAILNGLSNINILYLSPSYIIKKWKIINYMEQMVHQNQRQFLESEDKLYLAPELYKYLDIELNDCDDFNKHLSQEINAPKASVYSLGIILLQCIYFEFKKDNTNNYQDILKNSKYSWSLRDLIQQMLREEDERSSIKELLSNPLFYEHKQIEIQPKQSNQMSLAVFFQFVKNKFFNLDWADQFFSMEEIIYISDLKEGIYPIGELKSEINSQITQIIQNCPNNCTLEELIATLTKIANPQQQEENQVIQPKKQQFLFRKWFKKQEQKSEDMQEQVLAPQEPTYMAQVLLLKLISQASEKAFQTFISKVIHFMGGSGLIWQNIRKAFWPRALGFESLEAQRQIVQLTLELCEYLNASKEKDVIQLEKDLNRQKYSKRTQDAIRITIRGFINQSVSNCYIQGMDSISYILLEAFNYDSELSTICLNEIYKKRIVNLPPEEEQVEISEYFGQKLQEKILLYNWTLQYFDPGLSNHLKETDFKCETHIVSWFSTFYAREFNLENVMKIYDYFLISDESFEILLACQIMLELKSTFEIKDSEGMLSCLKNLQNNIQLDNCLQNSLRFSTQLHKTFFILTHQDEEICNQMKEENEYLQERPWEHPLTFKQLQEQLTFSISIHDFQQLLREQKSSFNVLSLDMRSAKDYEQACISGSLFAYYDKKKINNIQLLNYFELRGLVEEQNIYYIVVICDSEKQNVKEIMDYLLKQRIKRLVLLKGGIQAALLDAQDIIKVKQKAVLPPWIKLQIDELKKKNIQSKID
ncbi:unnamed protein product [Paramecium pentaurelia]|uniref:Uncharacterized protein n=1 Tax=Paramecium pentaurelia TaxID=43138 RepID=A0A8S1W3I1_9CILI|nr:unnamed protein product [Paramecium pentaurelia]